MNINEIKAGHVILKEYGYKTHPIDKGYNNRTLYINLSDNTIAEKPVSEMMKEKFIGGKGFGLKLLWEGTRPETRWDDPENEIVIAGGPVCGITQYSGTGKSLVVSISPLTDSIMDCNVGGYFGPFLKFCGFDAIEIQGKAERDVIIYLDKARQLIQIYEAPLEAPDSHILAEQISEMYAQDENDKATISVVSAGSAADHTLIGMLNFTFYDKRKKTVRLKQAGRGGIGTVFRNKKIKAIVAKVDKIDGAANNVVDIAAIQERGKRFNREMRELDDSQCEMRTKGTVHLVEIMNDHDLLPTHNFKFGSHTDFYKIHSERWKERFIQGTPDGCWIGCNMSCAKAVGDFELKSGPYKGQKVLVDGAEYETAGGVGSNTGIFDIDFIIEANFYCDTYGIDTISYGTLMAFVMECYENGILNEERTGGLKTELRKHRRCA